MIVETYPRFAKNYAATADCVTIEFSKPIGGRWTSLVSRLRLAQQCLLVSGVAVGGASMLIEEEPA